MRVSRIIAGPTAQTSDFASLAGQGRSVPRTAPAVVSRKWAAVSAFTTLELAERRAKQKNLGGSWAALELPDDVEVEVDPPHLLGRHVSIYGRTPEQLLSYVVAQGVFEARPGVE